MLQARLSHHQAATCPDRWSLLRSRSTRQMRLSRSTDAASPPSDVVQKPCFHAESSDTYATRPIDVATSVSRSHSNAYATRPTNAATSVSRSHSHAPAQFHSVRHWNSAGGHVCCLRNSASVAPACTGRARVARQTLTSASVAPGLRVCRVYLGDTSLFSRFA
jgi:hypothetical protein